MTVSTGSQPLFRRYASSRRSGATFALAAFVGITLLLVAFTGDRRIHHPYDQHGYLAFDADNSHNNRWTPYAQSGPADQCKQPAPALAASFLRASWASTSPSHTPNLGMLWADAPLGPDGKPWQDVEWARNKTVFFMGDSISRFTSHYVCEMAGEKLIELNWNHPWSPPQIPKDFRGKVETNPPVSPADPPLDPFGWHKIHPGAPISHIGHYCYVPGLDFLLVHVHTYGLDQEDYWAFKPTYIPPYTFEERINMLGKAYLDRIRATTGRGASAPELVYVNSGMWDVVKYSHEDTQANLTVDTPLGPDRLDEYRSRVRDVVLETSHVFPQAQIHWAATHYPIVQSGGWFFNDAKVKPKTRPDMKLIRLQELHEAAMSAIWDIDDASAEDKRVLRKVQLNRWGLAMRGWEKEQVDDLHPKFLPGGYLWADMMLWDLRAALA